MVKDEEENIHRCLESMQEIIARNDVELIIVDTGSSDSTDHIAKKYTDKVYYHLWNDHFAEMRNVTISYAEGEWLFILDADEQLVDVPKMKNLLENLWYFKDYNTITININNFTSSKNDKTVLLTAHRLFRNSRDFQYKGAVHNQPQYKEPLYHSEINFNHYGYLNDDTELMEKKFQRTSKILKDELQKDPDNIYYHYQLARSYNMYKDYTAALETIKHAMKLAKSQNVNLNKFQYLYINYAKIAQNAKEFNDVIYICEEGLNLFPEQIDLIYMKGLSHFVLQQNDKAVEAFSNYLKLYEKKNLLTVMNDITIEVFYAGEENKKNALQILYKMLYEKKSYEEAIYYAEQDSENSDAIQIIISSLLHLKDYTGLVKKYCKLKVTIEANELIEKIENEKHSLSVEQQKEMESAFSKVQDPYGLLNVIRTSNENETPILINDFLNNYDVQTLHPVYYDIFLYLLDNSNKFIQKIKRFNAITIKKIASRINYAEYDQSKIIETILHYRVRQNDIESNRVLAAVANVVLLNLRDDQLKNYYKLFIKYIESGKNFVSLLYQKERLRLIYRSLNDEEHKFFIILCFVEESIQNNNIDSAMNYYREAVKQYPYMARFLSMYLSELCAEFAYSFIQASDYSNALTMFEESLLLTDSSSYQKMILEEIDKIQGQL